MKKKSPGSISDVSGADLVAFSGGGPQTPGGFDAPSRRPRGGFPHDGEITAASKSPRLLKQHFLLVKHGETCIFSYFLSEIDDVLLASSYILVIPGFGELGMGQYLLIPFLGE